MIGGLTSTYHSTLNPSLSTLLLKNIVCPITETPDFKTLIRKKFGFELSLSDEFSIVKRAIDARHRNHLQFVYTISLKTERKLKNHTDIVPETVARIQRPMSRKDTLYNDSKSIYIIGMGPAGLFAALKLTEYGYKPTLFEQGDCIETRKTKVEKYWQDGTLDPLANVQFGEGGAGAFSDGKLTARSHNAYTDQIFNWLIKFGADPDISINALPHIGTDKLLEIIKKIKQFLHERGCQLFYNHKLNDIEIANGRVKSVLINQQRHSPDAVILATGNSARDVFELCLHRQIPIENKPFAVGLRIEHPLEYINHTFYGEKNDFSVTGNAVYRLTATRKPNTEHRTPPAVYSFCMCPGGFIIPASSEPDGQVVNGMSYSSRDHHFSNSALVVGVDANIYGKKLLDGVRFQQGLEKLFYRSFAAPAQNVSDFMKDKHSSKLHKNSYLHCTISQNLAKMIPEYISHSLSYALTQFNQKYKGFIANGLFIAVETRTSSPIRILRDTQKLCSPIAKNLFPAGEGSGYAGGIISSAADGLKIAEQV